MLTVSVAFDRFEDWWEPFTFGVGPSGELVAGLDDAGRMTLRDRCEERLQGPGPFEVVSDARLVIGRG